MIWSPQEIQDGPDLLDKDLEDTPLADTQRAPQGSTRGSKLRSTTEQDRVAAQLHEQDCIAAIASVLASSLQDQVGDAGQQQPSPS
jgi:hypothetical protein